MCPPTPLDQDVRTLLDQQRYAEAFELVLARYQAKVFRLAYSILGNRALAEETGQDVFLRIWRALPRFRAASSISTWIFTITRNASLSALRGGSRRQALSLDEPAVRAVAEARYASAREDAPTPDLQRLVAQLPEKYRQAIALFYMEERSYEEVARLLDLPLGTVKTYLHRAKKELARAVLQSKMGKEVR